MAKSTFQARKICRKVRKLGLQNFTSVYKDAVSMARFYQSSTSIIYKGLKFSEAKTCMIMLLIYSTGIVEYSL